MNIRGFVTGVGSRDISIDEYDLLFDIIYHIAGLGYVLRSGDASGSDNACQLGYLQAYKDGFIGAPYEAYVAWNSWRANPRTKLSWLIYPGQLRDWRRAELTMNWIHPAANKLRRGGRALHTRNIFQVLGLDLNTPSTGLVCCADADRNGVPKGGTRTAWVMARRRDIPCLNIRYACLNEIEYFIERNF